MKFNCFSLIDLRQHAFTDFPFRKMDLGWGYAKCYV